jgi:transposase-like protein
MINVKKNVAYPPAVAKLKKDSIFAQPCKLRQVKYFNNVVGQNHRFIKRRVTPGLGFVSFRTAARTLRRDEIQNYFICL